MNKIESKLNSSQPPEQCLDLRYLDALCIEYIKYYEAVVLGEREIHAGLMTTETLSDKADSPGRHLPDDHGFDQIILDLFPICRLLVCGKVGEALTLTETICPRFASKYADFWRELKTQEFIEEVRNADIETTVKILQRWHNSEHAHLLDKDMVILLLYQNISDTNHKLFDPSVRVSMSKRLLQILRLEKGLMEPALLQQTKYLQLVSNMYYALKGMDSPYEYLILPERLDQIEPNHSDSSELFDERAISLLAQTLGCNNIEASNALELSKGNVGEALLLELERISFDHAKLYEISSDYLKSRKTFETSTALRYSLSPAKISPSTRSNRPNHIFACLEDCVDKWDVSSSLIRCEMLKEFFISLDTLNQSFSLTYPELYFGLKRLQLMEYVRSGDFETALKIIKNELSVQAKIYPQLSESLRESAMMLIYPSPTCKANVSSAIDVKSLYSPLYLAICHMTDNDLPELVVILRGLLSTHSLSFKERCETDIFESALKLDKLRGTWKDHGLQKLSPQPTQLAEFSFDDDNLIEIEKQADSEQLAEEDISTLQDILSCSRIEAISFLLRHQGNINAAIETIFQ